MQNPDAPFEEAIGKLVILNGPREGEVIVLKERNLVGRVSECDIQIVDATISRRHAEFVKTGDSFIVRDVASTCGIYVNEERANERLLQDGDRIRLGQILVRFVLTKP